MIGSLNRSVIAPLSSAIITVLIAGLVVAGVDSVDRNKVDPGTARLEPNGIVEIAVAGSPFVRASHGRTLRAKDQVRVIDGRAVLDLSDKSKLELRAGSVLTINGDVQPEVTLDDGDLLVETGRGDTVTVDGGTAALSVAGSAKVRRGVSLAAGVYEGTARLARNDEGLTIPQYRQAAVVGTGILPPAAEPLNLAASDEWDRRMAGSVMALDEQLMLITQAFEADAPAGAGPDQFKAWMPKGAALPITPELLAGRAVGENLIGLTLVALDKGDFNARVASIFGFRTQGASWGLVAADRAINPNPVIEDLEFALGKLHPEGLTGDIAAPSFGGGGRRINIGGGIFPIGTGVNGGGGVGGTGGTGGGTGGAGGGTGGGTGGGNPGGGGTPGGGNPGGGGTPGGGGGSPKLIDVPPTGTFLDPVLNPLVTPVEDLLSGLLGGLLGQGVPSTSSTPTKSGTTTVAAPPTTPTTPPATAVPSGSGTTATGTGTAGTGSGPTSSGSTAGSTTPTTTSGGLLGGLLGTTPLAPTTTTTTTRPATTPTTSPSSSGLLGGIVGGLTKTVGGLL